MKAWNCLTVLLLVLPSALSLAYTHPGSLLYPYGPAYNHLVTPVDDDGGTEAIAMTRGFTFFGETYHELFVNNNGAISFKDKCADYTPEPFPMKGTYLIAPYWADVDNEVQGEVHYSQLHQETDKETFERSSSDVKKAFPNLNFTANWGFMATWDQVAYHGTESDKTNTFQCVLLSDKQHSSIVIFNYYDIQWTTGTASGGDPHTGLGGIPAQAGFNTDADYFNVPLSRTDQIINIKSSSNIGLPGRWIFQVNEFNVPGGCVYRDSFLRHGETIWTDDSCGIQCSCRFNGKVVCEDKPCDEGLVCLPLGRYHMCQINEEDC